MTKVPANKREPLCNAGCGRTVRETRNNSGTCRHCLALIEAERKARAQAQAERNAEHEAVRNAH